MPSPSRAPGTLEQVRAFLNTWELPHETRVPTDHLPALAALARTWRAQLPDLPRPDTAELATLTRLRTDLRAALGDPSTLDPWLAEHPVRVALGTAEEPLHYLPHGPGTTPAVLALVAAALADRRWVRLKACPDCRHVFYDHSRNRTRTWCAMYAETPDGRACGSIAKVRSYRDRRTG